MQYSVRWTPGWEPLWEHRRLCQLAHPGHLEVQPRSGISIWNWTPEGYLRCDVTYEQTCEGCPTEWASVTWYRRISWIVTGIQVQGCNQQSGETACSFSIPNQLFPLHTHLFNTQAWFSRLILSFYPALHSLFPQACPKHMGYNWLVGSLDLSLRTAGTHLIF